MSKEELRKYIPDTPEELSYIGGSINRLGIAIAGVSAYEGNLKVTLFTLVLVWLGNELSGYFKIWQKKNEEPKP